MKSLLKLAAPYGLTIIENCLTCVMHEQGLFCDLPMEAVRDLNAIRQNSFYPQGAVLFVEGEDPRGLFILCSGQAKISAGSKEGRNITLREVQPGEVLGLSSVIANEPFPVAAETLAPSQVSFLLRKDFLAFLHKHPGVAMRVAEHLSMELHRAWGQAKLLSLAPSARAKLAQFLVSRGTRHGKNASDGLHIPLNLTHADVAESIGATRETVSRLLADFKRKGLIRIKGGTIVLLQPDGLRALGES